MSTHRPILLIGPRDSDAARAVRHWRLGPTTTSQDEAELAALLDAVAVQESGAGAGDVASPRELFLEVFSRNEARRRLLGDAPRRCRRPPRRSRRSSSSDSETPRMSARAQLLEPRRNLLCRQLDTSGIPMRVVARLQASS